MGLLLQVVWRVRDLGSAGGPGECKSGLGAAECPGKW